MLVAVAGGAAGAGAGGGAHATAQPPGLQKRTLPAGGRALKPERWHQGLHAQETVRVAEAERAEQSREASALARVLAVAAQQACGRLLLSHGRLDGLYG